MFFKVFKKVPLLILAALYVNSNLLAEEKAIKNEFLVRFSSPVSTQALEELNKQLGLNIRKENKLSGSLFCEGNLDKNVAKNLIASGLVDYIEPNYELKSVNTPNDPLLRSQWPNQEQDNDIDLDLMDAWQVTTGSDEVVVGVIDSGINYNHPDLIGNTWQNPAEIPFNGIDDDANGVVDDYYGFNSVSNTGDPIDNNGHGSHVSGIIGAQGNNSLGTSGVNWNVKLLGIKFLDGAGFASTQNAIEAIEYAVAMKRRGVNLKVLSNSWGGSNFSRALEDAVRSSNQAGILFVAAAGNSGTNNDLRPIYPSSLGIENVVSVSAVDQEGNLANFSNYGRQSVDLAGPGVDIYSTWLGSDYNTLSGTSMAAPYVAGVAALILSAEPDLSISELKARLTSTIRTLPGLNGLMQSAGMVNAGFAINNRQAPPEDNPVLTEYSQTTFPARNDAEIGERILAGDDGYHLLELPFEFDFFDESFRRIAVSANGRVVPLGVGEPLPTESDFANNLRPGILPWHDDLFPSPGANGGVWAKVTSSAVTLTWNSRPFALRSAIHFDSDMRIQAVIRSSGRIEFNYVDLLSEEIDTAFGSSATVGLIPFISSGNSPAVITHNRANPDVLFSGSGLGFSLGEGDRVHNDFDGDGRSELVVWRPSSGNWFISQSSSDYRSGTHSVYQLGLPGDIPLTGDFDGDGKTDMTVWRPTDGNWFFRLSRNSYSEISSIQWGLPGDIPLADDFDGDNQTDLAVYRQASGHFFLLLSSNNYNHSQGQVFQLGDSQHLPLTGDYDGDNKADLFAIWRPAKIWSIKDTGNNLLEFLPWGLPGDRVNSCDWDGDGRWDRLVTRINGQTGLKDWFVAGADGSVFTKSFGLPGDIPSCNKDFDGDGLSDTNVWRPADGNWFIDSSSGRQLTVQFGLPGDIPL